MVIERLDQGHLYPLGERQDIHVLRPPAPQAAALPKELSRQLIRWLFGPSIWVSLKPASRGIVNSMERKTRVFY
jgi:hypothetical protein